MTTVLSLDFCLSSISLVLFLGTEHTLAKGFLMGIPSSPPIRIRWPYPSSVPANSDGLPGSYAPWMTFSLHGASVYVEKKPLDHRNVNAT